VIYFASGSSNDAASEWQKAVDLIPGIILHSTISVWPGYRLGQIDEARKDLEKALYCPANAGCLYCAWMRRVKFQGITARPSRWIRNPSP